MAERQIGYQKSSLVLSECVCVLIWRCVVFAKLSQLYFLNLPIYSTGDLLIQDPL